MQFQPFGPNSSSLQLSSPNNASRSIPIALERLRRITPKKLTLPARPVAATKGALTEALNQEAREKKP
jgi:hypothetical protein